MNTFEADSLNHSGKPFPLISFLKHSPCDVLAPQGSDWQNLSESTANQSSRSQWNGRSPAVRRIALWTGSLIHRPGGGGSPRCMWLGYTHSTPTTSQLGTASINTNHQLNCETATSVQLNSIRTPRESEKVQVRMTTLTRRMSKWHKDRSVIYSGVCSYRIFTTYS